MLRRFDEEGVLVMLVENFSCGVGCLGGDLVTKITSELVSMLRPSGWSLKAPGGRGRGGMLAVSAVGPRMVTIVSVDHSGRAEDR